MKHFGRILPALLASVFPLVGGCGHSIPTEPVKVEWAIESLPDIRFVLSDVSVGRKEVLHGTYPGESLAVSPVDVYNEILGVSKGKVFDHTVAPYRLRDVSLTFKNKLNQSQLGFEFLMQFTSFFLPPLALIPGTYTVEYEMSYKVHRQGDPFLEGRVSRKIKGRWYGWFIFRDMGSQSLLWALKERIVADAGRQMLNDIRARLDSQQKQSMSQAGPGT